MAGLDGLFGGRRWLLAAGGLGTSFFAQGLPAGDGPEVWNVTRRQSVRAAHAAFLAAGSDLILTNSFGANRPRLELHRQGDQVAALNRAAAEVARDAVEDHRRRTGKPAWVAGSMGPTGSLFTPLGPLTDDAAVAIFTEQATALAAGGVDLLWVETMSDEAEVKTAVAAARATGLPVVCTMSFDTHQRTMMGVAPADFAGFWVTGDGAPNALGANCGIGPAEALDTVLDIAAAAPSGDLAVKGNCGVPFIDQGQVCYRAAPATMADYACLARDAGARIIGGCCGTGPLHVGAMAAALADRAPGGRCDRDRIAAVLGVPWNMAIAATPRRDRRRRR